MPYKDPERKQAWERAHRSERTAARLEALRWSDRQIAVLRAQGVTHSPEEWSKLRSALVASRLNAPTREALRTPTAG